MRRIAFFLLVVAGVAAICKLQRQKAELQMNSDPIIYFIADR